MIISTSSTSNLIKDFELVISKSPNGEERKSLKSSTPHTPRDYCTINDTDQIYFNATLNTCNKNPCYLQIGDILIAGTPRGQENIEFRFRGNGAFFQNFCGYAQLTLQIYTSNRKEEKNYYLQVCTDKIKKEYIEDILIYLDSKIENIFFTEKTITYSSSIKNQSNFQNYNQQIIVAEELTSFFSGINLNHMNYNKISEIKKISNINKAALIDNSSILWLSQNTSEIYKSTNNNIKIGQNKYQLNKILNTSLNIKKDIYENNIILSYISNIITTISNILQKISAEQKRKESDSNVIPNNSFEYLYRDYLIKTYELNKKKCIKIISNLTSIRKKLAKIYGKTTIYNLISKPHMTMCFKNNFFYQKIYPLLLNWWKCSNVTALEKNDIPLENIAKLYEFLCLFKIFDAINSVLNITPLKHDSTLLLKSKQYIWTLEQGETITLFYEPIIFSIPKETGLIRVSKTQDERYNYYTPDFVIKYCNKGYETFCILDAKFSNVKIDNIFKYFTDITNEQFNRDNIILISIIKPEFANTAYKYNSLYINDIFSKNVTLPELSEIYLSAPKSKTKLQDIIQIFIKISKEKYFEKNPISRKKYTYKSSSILDDTKISLIKGMILRGDNLQDIAFWFGVNLGRISEIKSGIKYNDILPADKNNLPPQGPYPSLSELFKQ